MRTWRSGAVLVAGAALCLGLTALMPGNVAATVTAGARSLHSSGSIDEAWLTGATPGDRLTLLHYGSVVSNPGNPGTADSLGSLIIRNLSPGAGYSWRDDTTGRHTQDFNVLAPYVDPYTGSALYTRQPMHQGLNYITIRDGIKLAATVRYPYGVTCSAAHPCPTVIEYSGYNVAGPTDPIPYVIAERARRALHELRRPEPAPGQRDLRRSGARPAVGVRHRQPPDAWHRLLGRRVRPLRLPLRLRRLRRD